MKYQYKCFSSIDAAIDYLNRKSIDRSNVIGIYPEKIVNESDINNPRISEFRWVLVLYGEDYEK